MIASAADLNAVGGILPREARFSARRESIHFARPPGGGIRERCGKPLDGMVVSVATARWPPLALHPGGESHDRHPKTSTMTWPGRLIVRLHTALRRSCVRWMREQHGGIARPVIWSRSWAHDRMARRKPGIAGGADVVVAPENRSGCRRCVTSSSTASPRPRFRLVESRGRALQARHDGSNLEVRSARSGRRSVRGRGRTLAAEIQSDSGSRTVGDGWATCNAAAPTAFAGAGIPHGGGGGSGGAKGVRTDGERARSGDRVVPLSVVREGPRQVPSRLYEVARCYSGDLTRRAAARRGD